MCHNYSISSFLRFAIRNAAPFQLLIFYFEDLYYFIILNFTIKITPNFRKNHNDFEQKFKVLIIGFLTPNHLQKNK